MYGYLDVQLETEFHLFFLCQPENILCVSMDSHDIKLVDFGLARHLDTEDEVKSSFGTPDFVGEKTYFFLFYQKISLAC